MSFEKPSLYIYKSGQDGDGSFLDAVSIIDDYATLSFTHGHYAPGNFEVTTNDSTKHASDLIRGRIVRIGEDNTRSAIINSIRKSMDEKGNVITTISGSELWSLLGRRQVIPPAGSSTYSTTITTPVETGVKAVIEQNAGSTATASRVMSSLSVVATAGGGACYKFSERYSNLMECVSKALLATNSGITVTLDHTNKKWILGWTAGTDRTSTVILSSKYNTAKTATVNDSDASYRNIVIAAGQGEGVNRNVRVLYDATEPTGIDRREIFRDMRDLSVDSSIDQRAAQVLAEQSYTKTIEVSPLAYSKVIYGIDYFVGDKIAFDELGVSQDCWITSATEQWKAGSYDLRLGVDKAPATIAGQVSSLASSNNTAFATIENLVYTTDGTLAGNSDLQYPTEKAVKTYVDTEISGTDISSNLYNSQIMSFGFDDVPVIDYSFSEDSWTDTSAWTFTTLTETHIGGILKVATTSASGASVNGFSIPITLQSTSAVKIRIKRVTGTSTSVLIKKGISGSTLLTSTVTNTGQWYEIGGVTSSSTVDFCIQFRNANAGEVWQVDYIKIVDANYSWRSGDESGNGLSLIPYGGLQRVPGVSGYALEPDGVSGALYGSYNGISDKVTISFWKYIVNLTPVSGAIENFVETSSTSSTTPGSVSVFMNSSGGGIRCKYRTASSSVDGTYIISSPGLYHFILQVDTSVMTSGAVRLWVFGREVALSYSTVDTTSRPALYNGTLNVNSRNRTSLWSPGFIDEIRMFNRNLTQDEKNYLYKIRLIDRFSSTGYGKQVRAILPKFGDELGGNYTEFEEDGTLHMVGNATVYKDINVSGASLVKTGANAPDIINFVNANTATYAFDGGALTEKLYGTIELAHDYYEGTDVEFHIHWAPTTANTGNVVWQIYWTWQNAGSTFSASTLATATATAAGGTAWVSKYISVATLSGTGKTINSHIVFQVFRDPSNAGDTYPDDAALIQIGIHYQSDSLGSRTTSTK